MPRSATYLSCLLEFTLLVGAATIASAAPPPNDNFADAQALNGPSGSGSGTTVGATVEPGEPRHSGWDPYQSVWFAWTAPADGTLIFSKVDHGGTTVGMFSGGAVDSLTEIANTDQSSVDQYFFAVQEGVTYHISINIGDTTFTFQWEFRPPVGNDDFANSEVISGESGSVAASTLTATVEASEPHSQDGNSVWYSWIAPRTGSFWIHTTGFIDVFRIYSGNTFAGLAELFEYRVPASYTGFRAVEGTRYFIQVSGIGSWAPFDGNGDFTLAWSAGPVNDDLSDATVISGKEGAVTGHPAGGTEEPNEPTISGYAGVQSIWYLWTAPVTSWYTFRAVSHTNALGAAVYTGTNMSALSQIAASDGPSYDAKVTFHAEAGTSSRITVAGIGLQSFEPPEAKLSWRKGDSVADAALLNLSTRAEVGLDSDVLIGGFIVRGDAPKKLLFRAIGPSLEVGGTPLSGRLANPLLELHDSKGEIIFSNDDWVNSPQKQAIVDTTIPPPNEKEAAILATLQPGEYTAVVRGAVNATGVALMEVYDLEVTSSSRLINLSSRGVVKTKEDVMIAGLILGGSVPTKIVTRALGPSLAEAHPPVVGALQNPYLELRDANGALINDNDDYVDSRRLSIEDTGLAPSDRREAALLTTLTPSNYTIVVRSADGSSTGVALVEVYNLQ